MFASPAELIAVLHQFNPWWRGARVPDLPRSRRQAFDDVLAWVKAPPAPRALLLAGARQIGKTTLFLQVIEQLIEDGVPPNRILYATFDHPLLKLLGPAGLLDLWRTIEPESGEVTYLFLDEIQGARAWQTWLKHQVDFERRSRIAVTGSATPLVTEGQESGVGRWHTLPLAPLSFFEYARLKGVAPPTLPAVGALAELAAWGPAQLAVAAVEARALAPHFHAYLVRGGFPQGAMIESVTLAQKLLREDLVDKVLMRDMTALFGVRHVLGLERTFLYLCMHGGGLLDVQALCVNLELKRATVLGFLDLLARTHLIHKLAPYGHGKEVLRARYKVYLADPAIAPSVLLRGTALLEDEAALGLAAETAAFTHVRTAALAQGAGLSYWHGKRGREVDMVVAQGDRLVPVEVKYRGRGKTGPAELAGLREMMAERGLRHGFVFTKDADDMGPLPLGGADAGVVTKVPTPLACYWLGAGAALG